MAGDRVRVKGTGFGSSVRFIESALAQRWPELEAKLSPAAKAACERVLPSSWMELPLLAELYAGYAKLLGEERRTVAAAFNRMGRFIAEDNLNTVYRFVLKVLSPAQFLSMLPTLWNTYFQGLEVKIEEERGARKGFCFVGGFDRLPYINLAAIGWMEYGFEITGAKRHDITERGWLEGRSMSPMLAFDIRWE